MKTKGNQQTYPQLVGASEKQSNINESQWKSMKVNQHATEICYQLFSYVGCGRRHGRRPDANINKKQRKTRADIVRARPFQANAYSLGNQDFDAYNGYPRSGQLLSH